MVTYSFLGREILWLRTGYAGSQREAGSFFTETSRRLPTATRASRCAPWAALGGVRGAAGRAPFLVRSWLAVRVAMLTRLWNTVKALRELNRTAPEVLRAAAARRAENLRLAEESVKSRKHVMDEIMKTVDKTLDRANEHQQAVVAKKLAEFEAKLNNVQLDHGKIQQKAMSNMADSLESTLLKTAGGGEPRKS